MIQIANWVTVQGSDAPCVKNIFTLKSCAPISGAEVHAFEKETEMLQAWRDFLMERYDPMGVLRPAPEPASSVDEQD